MARLAFLSKVVAIGALSAGSAGAQLDGSIVSLEHPAIEYRTAPLTNPVDELQQRLERGAAELAFDPRPGIGYLPALLRELGVPVESQLLVYSKTSFQQRLITPERPRALYFNDAVALGAVQAGVIEIAVQDAEQGAVFYTLETTDNVPRLQRQGACLGCHYSPATLGVPGFFARSVPTAVDGRTLPWLGNATMSHATPLVERWGGWYVTGDVGANIHLGNALIQDNRATELPPLDPVVPEDLRELFPADYLTPYSDAVAHLVFDHQLVMMNILTRVGWDFRVALAEGRGLDTLSRTIDEAVEYLLFAGEVRLEPVRGTSGFAEAFSKLGPNDDRGRSLRQLQLNGRLMRYPLSYLIYSSAFDGLPAEARDAMYRRLWEVLSSAEPGARYSHLSAADRAAIVEILIDTKPDLPQYFRPLTRGCALARHRSIAHGAAKRQRLRHGLALRAQRRRPVTEVALGVAHGEHLAVRAEVDHGAVDDEDHVRVARVAVRDLERMRAAGRLEEVRARAARRVVRVLEIRPLARQRERMDLTRVLVRRQQDSRREGDAHGETCALRCRP